ncbi:MAG: bifunctional phosphoribosylaminoimidazolecarboxamide formyltransferase/IMP cyclohydrolase, partial [Gemmatimonadota bacterium]|nr:bifunctional phosphoribosylaminoimidazolecarboxamide formyltransferase/IMP cyclohydrolase [Gemmatimonadota bacterium]
MPRALISVSDKRGVDQFAKSLVGLGWDVISTGGTAHMIRQAGVPVIPIEEVTGFPEIMEGRVKTLHPAVHASLLARRDSKDHMGELTERQFTPIDLVAVNLYPFRETIGRPDVKFDDAVEQIDIGGPSMLRSAAKNCHFVLPVVDPNDYDLVLSLLREEKVSPEFRVALAAKVFAHTAAYDAAIAQFLGKDEETFPSMMGLALERTQVLRYGENPFQRAALYVTGEGRGFDELRQLHGKELSFNNLLDVEAATSAVGA